MKHFAILVTEFLKRAVDNDWWKKLSPEEQKQYIKEHRRTKLRPTLNSKEIMQSADPVAELNKKTMLRLFSSIPKDWKKTLIYKGIGQDSQFEQLPDALRPRAMKQAFDNNTQAIVAFKSGTPITQMQPEFIITRSYEDEKFNCKRYKDAQGNVLDQNSYSSNVCEIKPRYRRGYRYEDRKSDLRMSNIVEKLPDQAYTVFAIKIDPERQKLRQMRSERSSIRKYRDVENKMIAKAVKPIYDYYSENLQKNLDQLRDVAVPSFENVLNADPYAKDPNTAKMEQTIQSIKETRDKLSSLNYYIKSIKRDHLPQEDEPYVNPDRDSDSNKRRIHEFLDNVKQLKTKFKDDYDYAIRMKKREAIADLKMGNFEDAADTLNSIDIKELANKVQDLSRMQDKSKVNIDELVQSILNANNE